MIIDQQSWAPQAKVLGSSILKDYILSSKFLVLAWALSTEPCSWLEIYKTNLTLPITWYFYQNLQFSPIIINKIMLMSAIFIEELWTNNISQYANDIAAIIWCYYSFYLIFSQQVGLKPKYFRFFAQCLNRLILVLLAWAWFTHKILAWAFLKLEILAWARFS